jgi:hypothetical protein
MSTLTEIEEAVDSLPPEQKQELWSYLQRQLFRPTVPSRHALPLVPAHGQPITQQEIDDALDAD